MCWVRDRRRDAPRGAHGVERLDVGCDFQSRMNPVVELERHSGRRRACKFSEESMRILFTVLITLQFLVVVLHDLVHVAGWTHGRQVRAVIGGRKLGIATVVNAIFPGLAVGGGRRSGTEHPKSGRVVNYW